MTNVTMHDIVNLAKNRGFVFAGSEIYGGLANSWDYGPYGSLLKENIKNLWIKEFVQKRKDMMLIDSSILLNPSIWQASGHLAGFADPLIDDKKTGERFRADKLLEDLIDKEIELFRTDKGSLWGPIPDKNSEIWSILNKISYEGGDNLNIYVNRDNLKDFEGLCREYVLLNFYIRYEVTNLIPESWSLEKQTKVMRGELVLNPNTKEVGDWSDARQFNLMYKTFQGVTEDSASTIYLRPETAQGIFVNFPNALRSSRRKLPFGLAQVGKAFRNEITPGNFIFRTREFEQMEIEYFCKPGEDEENHRAWKEFCMEFLIDVIGIKKENLKYRDHEPDELSHYSKATTDIEYKYPFGFGELWGIANRTDFDLKAHMTHSKQDMSYFDPINNTKYIPYVIEPSVGLNRLFLATLADAYTIDEDRIYLKLDPKLAPIKVGVLPVVKKVGNIATEIYDQLANDFIVEYDDVGSVGKRYARFDEIGTPLCVTVDSNNYEEGNITVRFRDSMEQEIVKISELNDYIKNYLEK